MLEFKDAIYSIISDILLKNEVLYLKLWNVSRQELRKVKGSEVYKTIDTGTLYLTDKKLIFVGNHVKILLLTKFIILIVTKKV